MAGLYQPAPGAIKLSARVERALRDGEPVVALESTIITHGEPRGLQGGALLLFPACSKP
jgi:pseudouridine-5'-phosphate glycosidase